MMKALTLQENMINGYLLKIARNYRGISQTDLAKKSGVPQSTISKIEAGLIFQVEEIENVSIDNISIALGFTKEFFFQKGRVYSYSICPQNRDI